MTLLERLRSPEWEHGVLPDRPILETEAALKDMREAADEIERLQASIKTVVDTFRRDEAQGYRSKDRQFAIQILTT